MPYDCALQLGFIPLHKFCMPNIWLKQSPLKLKATSWQLLFYIWSFLLLRMETDSIPWLGWASWKWITKCFSSAEPTWIYLGIFPAFCPICIPFPLIKVAWPLNPFPQMEIWDRKGFLQLSQDRLRSSLFYFTTLSPNFRGARSEVESSFLLTWWLSFDQVSYQVTLI